MAVESLCIHIDRLTDFEAVNQALVSALERTFENDGFRKTHLFEGRYENLYFNREDLPEVQPVLDTVMARVKLILGREDLRMGFWLNRMAPGDRTLVHSHDDDDELLSGVYYIQVPPHSGRLTLGTRSVDGQVSGVARTTLDPEAGMMAFFDPAMPHEVEANQSEEIRLSLGMNFGPLYPDP